MGKVKLKTIMTDSDTELYFTGDYVTTMAVTRYNDEGQALTKNYNLSIPWDILYYNYGCRVLRKNIGELWSDTFNDKLRTINCIKSVIEDVAIPEFKYKWATLIDVQQAYYNPFYNVDANETVTTVYGEDVTTHDYDEDKTTNQYGQDKTTRQYGQDKTTNQYGQTQVTNVYGQDQQSTSYGQDVTAVANGARQTTTTTKTNPFNDSNTLYSTGEESSNNSSVTDTTTRNAHSDTVTRDSHTDTSTTASKSDTSTRDSRSDTDTRDSHTDTATRDSRTDTDTRDSHTDTVTTRRYGNIGVTMTSQLLRDSALLAMEQFDVYKIIWKDIVSIICRGY